MDKIEVVRSEVVEPSNEINGLTSPTGGVASLKRKGNFEHVPHLKDTRRDLIAMRVTHGAHSAVGHHASNIAELLKMAKPPADLLKRRRSDTQVQPRY